MLEKIKEFVTKYKKPLLIFSVVTVTILIIKKYAKK